MSVRKGNNLIGILKTTSSAILENLNITPSTSNQTFEHPDTDGYDTVSVSAVTSAIDTNIKAENIKKNISILGVTGTLETGGKNVQGYSGIATVTAATMTTTEVKLTVAKTGTYKVSWTGCRNTTSGTSQSQLYIGTTAYGTAQATFTNSYYQSVVLTNVSLTEGQVITVYARARSTSYRMMVGNLIIEEQ